jgi:hypothetical protein
MAYRLFMCLLANFAAAIVLDILSRRLFRPKVTLPGYLAAKEINDGPKESVSGASAGVGTE